VTDAALNTILMQKITQAGIELDRSGLTPCGRGADNLVFAAQTIDGRHLIVKTPLGTRSRYGTAAWAARALARCGVPAPQVLWQGSSICIETRCPGVPLTGATDRLDTSGTTPHTTVLRAAAEAGALLRRAHSVLTHGYGRLTPAGVGPHRSLRDSLRADAPAAARTHPAGELASVARQVVSDNMWRLADAGPRLLVGDCAARHIFVDAGTAVVSGFIDLESARGGQPHADVAGFAVREHPQVTHAFLDGYYPAGPTVDDLWALTIHRARITTRLLLFHLGRHEHAPARRFADALSADLTAITSGTPIALPAHLQ